MQQEGTNTVNVIDMIIKDIHIRRSWVSEEYEGTIEFMDSKDTNTRFCISMDNAECRAMVGILYPKLEEAAQTLSQKIKTFIDERV